MALIAIILKWLAGLAAAAAAAYLGLTAVVNLPPATPPRALAPMCADAAAEPTSVEPGDGSMAIAVEVPRTAMLDVDTRGRVVAAVTNTGCAPTASDDLWLRGTTGSLTAASPDVLTGVEWYASPTNRYQRAS